LLPRQPDCHAEFGLGAFLAVWQAGGALASQPMKFGTVKAFAARVEAAEQVLKSEIARWRPIVKRVGLKID